MIFKMKPSNNGTRLGIVFNGSPLFSGGTGSGESEIRKWIIENDMLEAIIAMPDQLFYNTGIFTYIWILTNRKPVDRKGKIQVVNAVSFFEKMSRSLGNKRNEISDNQINEITGIYGDFEEGDFCRIFDNEDFGYNRITVERPLRLNFRTSKERIALLENEKTFLNLSRPKKKGKAGVKQKEEGEKLQQKILDMLKSMDGSVIYKNRENFEKALKEHCKKYGLALPAPIQKAVLKALSEQDETADVCVDKKGNLEPDTTLRDNENVPLKEDIREYFEREVLPHLPDAWIDESKTVKGYEINITKHFYKYKPLRSLEEIRMEILELELQTQGLMNEVVEI